jgi:two-component system chemotaxis sensor kinase CheA
MTSPTDFQDGFLDDYYAECDEHLIAIRRALLILESSVGRLRPDASVTEELFRSFHSIKGISGMVEHREGELLAHEMESYLRALREGDVRLSTRGIEALIAGTRAIEHCVVAHRGSQPAPDIQPVLTMLRTISSDDSRDTDGGDTDAAAGLAPALRCLFTPSPALIARGINVDVVRSRLRQHGEILRAMPLVGDQGAVAFEFLFTGAPDDATLESWKDDGMVVAPLAAGESLALATPAADEPVAAHHDVAPSGGHYVRVDLARLDELMRMIGDLVILRARLLDGLAGIEAHVPAPAWRAIQETTSGIERQLRELREGVMRVRLVPVGEIFRRMPFVVRDLARDTGRRVRVELKGQDTQIDKFLVERMMDPVLHLVRNAVAHGLEGVEERIAAGKPPEGTLSLTASAAGETVTIEIADDGRGLDADRVIARARQAGIAVPSIVDEHVLLDLICAPGLSTRDESDRASGRGFGMDVVRKTVQELGGTMQMTTEAGQGTRFIVGLPLTLAITDALIARVGAQTFAVPQSAVREVIEVDVAAIRMLEDNEVTPYRGLALPLVRLSQVLGIEVAEQRRLHVFVIGSGPAAIGLTVDRIVGQREIVVRAAMDPLIRVDGVGGATDLGDGRVVLILDAAAIARRMRARVAGALPRAALA